MDNEDNSARRLETPPATCQQHYHLQAILGVVAMATLTDEERDGYKSAKDDGEREYWARQVIIRQLRDHRERNQDLLRSEHWRIAKWLVLACVIFVLGMAGMSL